MDNTNDDHLLGEAARWSARLAAQNCTAQDRSDCEHWQQADVAHRAAFKLISATVAKVDRGLRIDKRLQQLADQAFAAGANIGDTADAYVCATSMDSDGNHCAEQTTHRIQMPSMSSMTRRDRRHLSSNARTRIGIAIAASMMLAVLVAWRLPGSLPSESSTNQTAELQAPIQSARHVTLADGTVVHLDAGSKLEVAINARERRIALLTGRAYFEVAHDATRPFSVSTNGTRTVALGTKFQVQRYADDTIVTLAQGSVAVIGKGQGSEWQERLQPGEQLKIDAMTENRQRHSVDASDTTSWSRGWLVFRGTPLNEAIREINRYSDKQVVIADAALTNLDVAGSFIAGDAQSIVVAIAAVLPIRVVDGGDHEILLFKRYEN